MDNQEVIEKTKEHIKNKFKNEGSGHDWEHINRVWKNAKNIGKEENADLFIVELAALLHDIADFKEYDGDPEAGPKEARKWLESLGVEEQKIIPICEIIRRLSFKGAGAEEKLETIEGKITRDADRLDAMGAIGIARCFAFGGNKGTAIYNPNIKPRLHNTKEEYLKDLKGEGTQINHFYEKLLLLKDLMLTDKGKKMAQERHKFMEEYLKQFFNELDANQ